MPTINNYDGGLTLAIEVSNLDESIAWYNEVMGFELLYRVDDIGWSELKSSVTSVNVGLSQVEELNPGGTTPTFGVVNIEAARDSLKDRGVKLDGDIVTYPGMVKLLTLYDPDGNALMIYEDIQTT